MSGQPGLAGSLIAQTLGVQETGKRPIQESLKEYLREKHLLLLLDNFEQVLDAAPRVAELLASCPGLKVLVTSRAVLHLRGEKEFPVLPLSLPDPKRLPRMELLSQFGAVALFIQRASDARPDFALTDENAPAVAEICHRLDGLPLAIELAAARTKLLPPQALLARLERRLPLLTGGARDLPARQQTLRGAIAWSYDLLDESEKQLFRRLSIFVGGFTLEAAETVCNAEDDLQIEVLDGVASLIDNSLLRREEPEAADPRFLMLETVREYGLECLVASAEAEAIRGQHSQFFLRLAEAAEPNLRSPDRDVWLARLKQELDNLRTVLAWSRAEPGRGEIGLRVAGALLLFWRLHGYYHEARAWLEGAVARVEVGERTAVRARALLAAGTLAMHQGDAAVARGWLAESVAIFRERGDKFWIAFSIGRVEEALILFRAVGDKHHIARSLNTLGLLAQRRGDHGRATALLEESLGIWRELGNRGDSAWSLYCLGNTALRQGKHEAAHRLYTESMALWREVENQMGIASRPNLGDQMGIALCLEGLAEVASLQGQPEQAVNLLGAASTLRDALGEPPSPADRADEERRIAGLRAELGEAAFAAAQSLAPSREAGR